MRKEDMRQPGQLMLIMNVSSHIQRVTDVPKGHSPDYSTRIRPECGSAASENALAQEYARILHLH